MNLFARLTIGIIAAAGLGYVLAGPKTRKEKSDERGLESSGGNRPSVSGDNRPSVPVVVSGKGSDGEIGQLTEPGTVAPVPPATVENADK